MHKNINEIKKLESPPQVIKNLFDKNEIEKFRNLKMQFIKLSENILKTSTAAINTASVLAECREELMSSIYYS